MGWPVIYADDNIGSYSNINWVIEAAEHSTMTKIEHRTVFNYDGYIPEELGKGISYFEWNNFNWFYSIYEHTPEFDYEKRLVAFRLSKPNYILLSYNEKLDTAYLSYALLPVSGENYINYKTLVTWTEVSSENNCHAKIYFHDLNMHTFDYSSGGIVAVNGYFNKEAIVPKYSFDDSYSATDDLCTNISKLVYLNKVKEDILHEDDVRSGNVHINGKLYLYGEMEADGSSWNLNNSSLRAVNELEVDGSSIFNKKAHFYNEVEVKAGLDVTNELSVGGTASVSGDAKIAKSLTVEGTARTNGDLVTTKIKPKEDSKYDIGNNSKHYKNVYLSNGIVTGTDSANQFTQKIQQKAGTLALLDDIDKAISYDIDDVNMKITLKLGGK